MIGSSLGGDSRSTTGDGVFSLAGDLVDALPSMGGSVSSLSSRTVGGARIEDFRLIWRSTGSGSLLRLTTRCDIFLSIVPVRANGDSPVDGDRDRLLLEGDRSSADSGV